jgi:two-component sensor histidine kinase
MSAAQSAVTEQILAELMTNALEHGASPAHIHAHVTQIRAVVEVTDAAPGRPVIRDAGEEDERGRGLALTAALASRWGVRTSPRGKTVWAEVLLAAHE